MRVETTIVELANGRKLNYDGCRWRVVDERLEIWDDERIVASLGADAWVAVEGREYGPERRGFRK